MRVLYPNMKIWIAGEVNNKTGIQCGTVENVDSMPFPIYRLGSHNKMTEKVVGYVCVDGFHFLAVVKNVFIIRLFLLILAASLFGAMQDYNPLPLSLVEPFVNMMLIS